MYFRGSYLFSGAVIYFRGQLFIFGGSYFFIETEIRKFPGHLFFFAEHLFFFEGHLFFFEGHLIRGAVIFNSLVVKNNCHQLAPQAREKIAIFKGENGPQMVKK